MRALLFILSLTVMGMTYQKSDHFDGKSFHNPKTNDLKSFWQVLKWKLTTKAALWPQDVPLKDFPLKELSPGQRMSAVFINHSTALIRLQGMTILTDPIYAERASPFSFAGPKRARAPGISFENLPPIDVVLVSHNHYDHLDLETLRRLDGKFKPLFIVPLGNEKLLKNSGIQNVKEIDWWEEVRVRDTRFILTEAQHWSARSLWDKNETLWGSFMIDNGAAKIFFGGDTGYSEHFLTIKSRLGTPDVALLPIGSYQPDWFMRAHHMNPEEAVKAHLDLGAQKSIAIHYGTFQLSDEGIDEPVRDLFLAKKKLNVPEDAFLVLDHGEDLAF
jgi:L-ascorbate metabolism protein UlaG (beta-lactamase superfamily)